MSDERRGLDRAVVATAALALVAHLGLAVLRGALPGARVTAIAAAVLLLAAGVRVLLLPRALRTLVACGAPLLLWWGALELRLASGSVYAAGLLLVVAAALTHATVLLVRLDAAAAVRRAALVISAVTTAAFFGEALVRAFVPVSVYEIVPDAFGGGECIVHDGDVTRLAAGFRGEYRHPEFPGLRVEINDLGLRDGLDEAPPDDDDVSVLVLGDSFVFGTGVPVDDTFHERLERRAASIAPGRRLRVYGAGVPGHGQVHAETTLERLAPRLRPDVVVVALYEANDFVDNMNLEGRRLGKVPSIESSEEQVARDRRAGRAGLDLGTYLRGVTRAPFWLGSSSAVQLVLPGLEERLVRWGWVEPFVPSNRFVLGMLRAAPPDYVKIGRAHLRIVLGRLKERCAGLGADLVVLLVPAAVQAVPARFELLLDGRPAAERGSFDRRAFHDGLAQKLGAAGYAVVDPIGPLEARAEGGEDPYLREGHWNAVGHAVTAERLAAALAELLAARED